jgi:hypothetical protein
MGEWVGGWVGVGVYACGCNTNLPLKGRGGGLKVVSMTDVVSQWIPFLSQRIISSRCAHWPDPTVHNDGEHHFVRLGWCPGELDPRDDVKLVFVRMSG